MIKNRQQNFQKTTKGQNMSKWRKWQKDKNAEKTKFNLSLHLRWAWGQIDRVPGDWGGSCRHFPHSWCGSPSAVVRMRWGVGRGGVGGGGGGGGEVGGGGGGGPQRRLRDPPDVYSRLMRCSGSGGPGTQRCASQREVTQRVEAPKPFLGLCSRELGSVGRGRSDKRETKLGDEAVLVTFGRGCSSGW